MLSRILIAIAAACLAGGAAAAAAREPVRCAEGTPEPSTSEQLRPTQTALCPYEARVLNRRIRSLLRVGSRAWTIEVVERIFGLPVLHAAYDSPWEASYSVFVSGESGHGDWRVMLNYFEGYWPRGGTRPARYLGSRRPARVESGTLPQISLTIDWLSQRDVSPDNEACLKTDELILEARRRGWRVREETERVLDAGPRVHMSVTRGKARIELPLPHVEPCVTRFSLKVEP